MIKKGIRMKHERLIFVDFISNLYKKGFVDLALMRVLRRVEYTETHVVV